jgi:LacI family transcriptional regulator
VAVKSKGKSTRPMVTAKDVAVLAGVSQSTVSRVLNNKTSQLISEETAQRVREAAAQLGYSPNPIARALRGKRTNLLGLVVREIADPFFAKFIEVLSAQARDENYHVVLSHAHSDPGEALHMASVLDGRQCDGVLLLGDLRDDRAVLQTMLRHNRAIVALCRGSQFVSVPTVNCDNRGGMRLLLDLLYELGHRRLAFIDGGWLGDIRERREAFLDYLSERNLTLSPEWIQAEVNDSDGGYRVMRALLNLSPRPTAVAASDDVMAIGALKAAADAGLRVPADISIVGFDDIEMVRFVSPSLTTVRQPIEEMCRRAIQLLLDMIDGQVIPDDEMLVQTPPELIVRESTGPVPAD